MVRQFLLATMLALSSIGTGGWLQERADVNSALLQWREMARELLGAIRIGAVNCGDEWILCQSQGIFAYPTLKMYPQVVLQSLMCFNTQN